MHQVLTSFSHMLSFLGFPSSQIGIPTSPLREAKLNHTHIRNQISFSLHKRLEQHTQSDVWTMKKIWGCSLHRHWPSDHTRSKDPAMRQDGSSLVLIFLDLCKPVVQLVFGYVHRLSLAAKRPMPLYMSFEVFDAETIRALDVSVFGSSR
jgi:hypothetical protein